MEIFPAIDILGGKVVRLKQGDYLKKTVYNVSPVVLAKNYKSLGAKNIHLVDLDGAKDGELSNFDIIKDISGSTDLFIEVGGGIRNEERIQKYIDIGVNRVILGTIATENREFVEKMVSIYGDKIAVGIDAKDGFVAIKGWKETTKINSLEFVSEMKNIGVKTVIYTDISKDGLESGTNINIYEKLKKINEINIIASGGVTYYEEIKKLKDMGIYGAIVGKALFNGTLELEKILSISK